MQVWVLDCLGTIVWQKGLLSSRVLPNGTQAISILCRFEYLIIWEPLYGRRGRCHLGYSPMVPRQSQSYAGLSTWLPGNHCMAEGVVVTLGTPQWYPGNLNPMQVWVLDCLGTIVWQKGSLSPWVLPNGTQAISILCRFEYLITWEPLYGRRGCCHLGYSLMVPRQSQSYAGLSTWLPGNHCMAEQVVVTLGTPQWYPGNLNPMQVWVLDCLGTIVWQKGSLSPWVLPNGTQAISILCRFEYLITWEPLYGRRGCCHLGYSLMVPRQSQSYAGLSTWLPGNHCMAEEVVVTLGTPQWYPGNLNPMQVWVLDCLGTIVWQKGSLSSRVLPNGTQAISILCRFEYLITWEPLYGRRGCCHLGYSLMVPRQSQSYAGLSTWLPGHHCIAEEVVVTLGTL